MEDREVGTDQLGRDVASDLGLDEAGLGRGRGERD